MKAHPFYLVMILLWLQNAACHKDASTPRRLNKRPVAHAGIDQEINLPINDVVLDGTGSFDSDGRIVKYLWAKVDGPASFRMSNPGEARTAVGSLAQGIYRFELTVTDDDGFSSKDTVSITVEGKTIIFDNRYWKDDPINQLVYSRFTLPGSYSVDKIKKVYFYNSLAALFGGTPTWKEIQKDGTTKGVVYYKIDNNNNGLVAYMYYSTPANILILDFPFKLKIEFL